MSGISLARLGGPSLLNVRKFAEDYVQDGLVAMWDGIENAGWGKHDASATVWKDLIRDSDAPLTDNSHVSKWGADYWENVTNNGGGYFSSTIPVDCPLSTLEVVVLKNTAVRGVIFGGYSINSGALINVEWFTSNSFRAYYGGGSPDFRYSGIFPIGKRINFSVTCERGLVYRMYRNATMVGSTSRTSGTTINAGKINIGSDARVSTMCFNGKIFSIRIYSRVLTVDEIAANYVVDAVRFGLS